MVERARELAQIKKFDWFAAGMLRAEYREDGGRHVVVFYDMRYSMRTDSTESLWGRAWSSAPTAKCLTFGASRATGAAGCASSSRSCGKISSAINKFLR